VAILKMNIKQHADDEGPVNWALGGTAKRAKKKGHGGGVSPVKKSGRGRDLINPSLPERRKKKAIEYKGMPGAKK
jgi:hypothetical protein